MSLFPMSFTFQWNFPLSYKSEVTLNLCLWYCSHFHGSRLWYHQWRIMPFLCVLAIKNYALWDKTSVYQAFRFSPYEAGKLLLNSLESSLGNGINESRNFVILAGDKFLGVYFLMGEKINYSILCSLAWSETPWCSLFCYSEVLKCLT